MNGEFNPKKCRRCTNHIEGECTTFGKKCTDMIGEFTGDCPEFSDELDLD